ncbi:MAG: type II secretion system F family protein [Planctomycetes bacterium]|nr:type II secretion system F family protein [Planctomycetota bacterium]
MDFPQHQGYPLLVMEISAFLTLTAFGGSVGFLFWALYDIGRGFARSGPLPASVPEARAEVIPERWVNLFLLLAEPLADSLESFLRRRPSPWLQAALHYYGRQVQAAGLGGTVRAADVVAMLPVSAAFGLLAGALAYALWPWPAFILAFAAAGLVLPWLWLRDRVSQRHDEMRRTLPFAIDILTLMTEAGLDFTLALERIGQKLSRNALGQELAQAQKEIQVGKSRAEAMRGLAQRTGLFELGALCAAIVQADELGSGFGPVLRVQADQIRSARAQYVEQKAMEAPVKILFPLIVFIFPTTFVVIFGPVFLSYLF